MAMDINQQKEQFSNAYVHAVAAVAGYACYKPTVDADSVDWGLASLGGGGTTRSPRVELQLKCTSMDVLNDDELAYPLKIKNYDELRHPNYMVPRILVVVVVPNDLNGWIGQNEQQLAMRHCGYWLSLRGMVATPNTETVSIHIPRTNQFNVVALTDMMNRVGGGGLP